MLLREGKKSETADPNDISTGTCQKTKENAEQMMTTFSEQQFPFWGLSASKVTHYDIYRLRTVSALHPQSTSRPRRSHLSFFFFATRGDEKLDEVGTGDS